jgi:hypothetical protein
VRGRKATQNNTCPNVSGISCRYPCIPLASSAL